MPLRLNECANLSILWTGTVFVLLVEFSPFASLQNQGSGKLIIFAIIFVSFCFQLRPPQPAIFLFVLDVSFNAVETGRDFVFPIYALEPDVLVR